ncbi:mandelate racemase/muconate lactonizing enzyme family protein [Leisingera sp. D0M16]|uniref:mandelate racemase/muconate lactonizing enzyme family protein n=1 Tax=Leisingera coralii TaxID=3351347 RepID=UPI003B7D07F1
MSAHIEDSIGRIERIQVYVVDTGVPRFSWSPTMPGLLTTNTIARVTTSDGIEGAGGVFSCTENDFDRAVAEGMRPLLKGLLGRAALRRESIWKWMQLRNLSVPNTAIAGLDIAMWDLAAKRANMPLYMFLGGARDRVKAYASTQVLDGPGDYAGLIEELREQGFSAFKFHYKCEPEADLEMMRLVHKEFHGQGLDFMFDADAYYTHKSALRVAREMSDMGFVWLEAPFPDHDLDGYRELRRRTDMTILPAGNSIVELANIAHAMRHDCWDRVRIDATTAGGLTPARKVLSLAEANGYNVEFQSWGCALSMAANLHLMLSNENCDYFEMPVPYSEFQVDALGRIEVDADGYVNAPTGAGLGLELDWDEIEERSVYKIDVS